MEYYCIFDIILGIYKNILVILYATANFFPKFQNSLTSDNDQILIDTVYIERKKLSILSFFIIS